MIAAYRLTQRASRQIREISIYTAKTWGKTQALRYIDDLKQRLDWLAASPELGRPRDEILPGLKAFPHERHIIYYRQSDEGIDVLAVLHQAQDNLHLKGRMR